MLADMVQQLSHSGSHDHRQPTVQLPEAYSRDVQALAIIVAASQERRVFVGMVEQLTAGDEAQQLNHSVRCLREGKASKELPQASQML